MSRRYLPPPALYPYQPRQCEVRPGLRLSYLDESPAAAAAPEVLLCLHGNPTWSFFFRSVVEAQCGQRRVIVPDHLGCGLSDAPTRRQYGYRLQDRVEDVAALLRHLGLSETPLTLVLHDWGGMIGYALAAQGLANVARFVVMNTRAFPLTSTERLPWELKLLKTPGVGRAMVQGLNMFASTAVNRAPAVPLAPEVAAAYLGPYGTWSDRLATIEFVHDIPLRPGDRSWDAVAATEAAVPRLGQRPTLVCWGHQDFVFTPASLAQWRQRVPSAQVHEFPQAGHYLLEDEPAAVNERIGQFLAANPMAAAGAER